MLMVAFSGFIKISSKPGLRVITIMNYQWPWWIFKSQRQSPHIFFKQLRIYQWLRLTRQHTPEQSQFTIANNYWKRLYCFMLPSAIAIASCGLNEFSDRPACQGDEVRGYPGDPGPCDDLGPITYGLAITYGRSWIPYGCRREVTRNGCTYGCAD